MNTEVFQGLEYILTYEIPSTKEEIKKRENIITDYNSHKRQLANYTNKKDYVKIGIYKTKLERDTVSLNKITSSLLIRFQLYEQQHYKFIRQEIVDLLEGLAILFKKSQEKIELSLKPFCATSDQYPEILEHSITNVINDELNENNLGPSEYFIEKYMNLIDYETLIHSQYGCVYETPYKPSLMQNLSDYTHKYPNPSDHNSVDSKHSSLQTGPLSSNKEESKINVPLLDEVYSQTPTQNVKKKIPHSVLIPPDIPTPTVEAIFPHEADSNIELTFQISDVIKIIERNNNGWWKGTCNGKIGYFPGIYTKPIT